MSKKNRESARGIHTARKEHGKLADHTTRVDQEASERPKNSRDRKALQEAKKAAKLKEAPHTRRGYKR